MKKWLFNPFLYLAGARALILGLASMCITAIICSFSNTHFDGIVDVHPVITPLAPYFVETLIDWVVIAAMLYLGGIAFSRSSIRLIDVAGTLALARWPLIIAAVAGFGIDAAAVAEFKNRPVAEATKLITPQFLVCSLVQLAGLIWYVALMYKAFSISCNLKGGKAAGIFIAALVLAEITVKLILKYL